MIRKALTKFEHGFNFQIGFQNAALELQRLKSMPVNKRLSLFDHGVGRHDFTTFRSAQCQAASPVKTLDVLEVTAEGDEVRFRLEARSFLHNQVRSLVGTLERVGAGKWPPERAAAALAARDRSACGPVAPPDGLYLTQVDYG